MRRSLQSQRGAVNIKNDINRVVRYSPHELKYLFKSPNVNRKMVTRLISRLVPYRVGLEFETFGSVTSYLKSNKLISSQVQIKDYLGVVDFNEDSILFKFDDDEILDLNEVRLSFNGYHQLIRFYDALNLFKKCLFIPSNNKGGIHIHIDCPCTKNKTTRDTMTQWFNKPEIQSKILRIFGGYKGTYNHRGASGGKGGYVRVGSQYDTVEFRIGRLTYDYSTIMNWIIQCSDLVRTAIKECDQIPEFHRVKVNKTEAPVSIRVDLPITNNEASLLSGHSFNCNWIDDSGTGYTSYHDYERWA